MLISKLSFNYEILVNESVSIKISKYEGSEHENIDVRQQDVISVHCAFDEHMPLQLRNLIGGTNQYNIHSDLTII